MLKASSNVGHAPMLPDLFEQIPSDKEIATVTADGAYDTRRCHNVIAARGATQRAKLSGHFLRKYPAGQWVNCVKLLG